ncbi:MAG: flagellar motor protein MotB [Alphaproteobacteria bacterium]
MADIEQTIIIKKVKKASHAAHHGGAWKVAYADFVTAMMAFFLLLWLLNATTEEQRAGISDYFAPASVTRTQSGSGGMLGGMSMAKKGAMKGAGAPMAVAVPLPTAQDPPETTEDEDDPLDPGRPSGPDAQGDSTGKPLDKAEVDPKNLSEEDTKKLLAEHEEKMFRDAEAALRKAIGNIPELRGFIDSLQIDHTPQGLRIQIHDQERASMFPLGSALMYGHTRKLLQQVVKAIIKLPNKISLTGHTDATPYSRTSSYTNWELSTDRALASRRALLRAGLPAQRITRVVGKAANEPLKVGDPHSPLNRRISIVLLRENQMVP